MLRSYISVLVPVRNEEKNIQGCLSQIFNQTYPKDKLEILVIDGGSTDHTLKLVDEFKANQQELKIVILHDLINQRSSGLNEGIRYAAGDLILRIDARTIIPENYIECCVNTLLETGADNVGGVQKPIDDESQKLTQLAIGCAMTHPFGAGNAAFRIGKKSGEVDSVYLGCFRREVFSRIGLFDEKSPIITEDSDINYRIKRSGGRVYLNKDIVAYYSPRENLLDLAKLYFRYGGARAGFMLKWKTFTGYRQLVPPLFLLILILLLFLSIFFPKLTLLLLYLLGVYLCCDLWVTLSIVRKYSRWKILPLLFSVFPIMHFSWAFGFWKRMLQRKEGLYWGY